MTQYQIITNNPLVKAHYEAQGNLRYEDVSYMKIFILVRDLVQKGHKLLTHPLAGSVKPNETPYRSVLISLKPQVHVDVESEIIIEECIIAGRKFSPCDRQWPPKILEDFQYVDYNLISNVLTTLN